MRDARYEPHTMESAAAFVKWKIETHKKRLIQLQHELRVHTEGSSREMRKGRLMEATRHLNDLVVIYKQLTVGKRIPVNYTDGEEN